MNIRVETGTSKTLIPPATLPDNAIVRLDGSVSKAHILHRAEMGKILAFALDNKNMHTTYIISADGRARTENGANVGGIVEHLGTLLIDD